MHLACRYGKAGVHFFTRTKTVTSNWKAADDAVGKRAPGLEGVGAGGASDTGAP